MAGPCVPVRAQRRRFLAHELDRILVAQIIRAFDRVVRVPFGFVFFVVAQRGADAALRRARVRTRGIQFADDSSLCRPGCVQPGHESRAARADNDHIKLMNIALTPSYEVQMR